MPLLADLQTAFAAAVLGDGNRIAHSVAGGGLAPAQRVQVYRNAVRVRLKDALADTYPVLRRLVGDACFDGVASEFLRRYPPRVGHLHPFGARMAELCARLPVLAGLPYLPDVARLEWAWQQAFHAAGAPGLPAQAFADVPDEQRHAIRLRLQAGASLLGSAYPIGRIFEVNQPDYPGDDAVSLDRGGESLLIIRRGFDVRVESLPAGEYALLAALAASTPLGDALLAAIDAQPDCPVGTVLARQIAAGTFTRLQVGDNTTAPTAPEPTPARRSAS